MNKNIINDIDNLLTANVITPDIAQNIRNYYALNDNKSQNNLFVIFGILGALLSGLGIILILAHNWDDLSNFIKCICAFIPLIIGQIFCGYSLLKKSESPAWLESSAVFTFFSIGASISLIAQIYNISGDFAAFILTWSLLGLPLVYLLQSSIVSLLYIVGITIYCCNTNFIDYPRFETNYWYFGLILGVGPHYFHLLKNKITSNFTLFHNWFLAISLLIVLSVFAVGQQKWIFIAYLSLLAVYYFIGKTNFFDTQDLRFNSFYIIGKLGTIFMLFQFSFNTFWDMIGLNNAQISYVSTDFFVAVFITILALILFIYKNKNTNFKQIQIVELIFAIAFICFIFDISMTYLANILVLLIGVAEINRGNKSNNLGILNYGLAIITILIICRFFDTDMSFAIRGILFLLVGFGFFVTNYITLKKRKKNEQ